MSYELKIGQAKTVYDPEIEAVRTGAVGMGNVKKQIPSDCSLSEFMSLWETFFFNSDLGFSTLRWRAVCKQF